MSSPESVILVDERDVAVGTCEKLEAHRRGLLHRAFSVFLKDADNRVLLQRRAAGKYHSANLWANSCCGHPRPGEDVLPAAGRRLTEELGIVCPLRWVRSHRYRAAVGADMTEDEFVHIFCGAHAGAASPNPAEVAECRWVPASALAAEIAAAPERYAPWLRDYVQSFGDEIAAWAPSSCSPGR